LGSAAGTIISGALVVIFSPGAASFAAHTYNMLSPGLTRHNNLKLF
jgi:hypothetical protein